MSSEPRRLTHLTHLTHPTHSPIEAYTCSRAHCPSKRTCVRCVSASVKPDSTTVARLADAVRRLSVHHRDPERFHLDKHSIAGELEALAAGMRRAGR